MIVSFLGYYGEYSRAGNRENEVVGFVLGKLCRDFVAAVDDLCGLFRTLTFKLCGGSECRKLFFSDEVAVAFKLEFRFCTVNLEDVLGLYGDIRLFNLKLARAAYNVVAALGVCDWLPLPFRRLCCRQSLPRIRCRE